jgi:hypothetical protein
VEWKSTRIETSLDSCVRCSDYLSKPVERQALLQTIKYHLGQGDVPATPAATADFKIESSGPIKSTMGNYPGMVKIIVEFVRDLPGEVQKLQHFLRCGQATQAEMRHNVFAVDPWGLPVFAWRRLGSIRNNDEAYAICHKWQLRQEVFENDEFR